MKIKRILKYFGISVSIFIVGFLVIAQIAYQSIPYIEPPGKMYQVNDTEIHMYCIGPENNNKPTIIIVPGGAGPSFAYFNLQEKLSETVRTCSYDPTGLGWSKPNDIPYPTIKSMTSNFILSFDQGKDAHYDRGDLPIVVLSAEGVISENSKDIGGISPEEARKGWLGFHKDLADLSSNGRHVIVNGTNHMSILDSDETAEHILSLIPLIREIK